MINRLKATFVMCFLPISLFKYFVVTKKLEKEIEVTDVVFSLIKFPDFIGKLN